MRIRAAGGLLIGVVLHQIARSLEMMQGGFGFVEVMKELLWWRGDVMPPGNTATFIILRDVLLIGGLVAGTLGVAGIRQSRIPIAVVASVIAVGQLPWAVYAFDRMSFDMPPRWVFENPLWYSTSRAAAVMWVAVCIAVVVLAVTDRAASYSQGQSYAPVPQPPVISSPPPSAPPAPPTDAT